MQNVPCQTSICSIPSYKMGQYRGFLPKQLQKLDLSYKMDQDFFFFFLKGRIHFFSYFLKGKIHFLVELHETELDYLGYSR